MIGLLNFIYKNAGGEIHKYHDTGNSYEKISRLANVGVSSKSLHSLIS